MFGTPKPTASLSSSLLARKGQARPAMRPQGFVGMNPATAQDDLGWNDMGDENAHAPQPVVPQPKPQVLRQIEQLDERFSQPAPAPVPVTRPRVPALPPVVEEAAAPQPEPVQVAVPAPAPVVQRPEIVPAAAERMAREVAKKSKAAFTLRLDNDRHLRLRLASAVTNRSAQQIVTEALDVFLESLTEVEALARQVGPGGNR